MSSDLFPFLTLHCVFGTWKYDPLTYRDNPNADIFNYKIWKIGSYHQLSHQKNN